MHTPEVCFQLGGDLSKELATLEECPGQRGKNPLWICQMDILDASNVMYILYRLLYRLYTVQQCIQHSYPLMCFLVEIEFHFSHFQSILDLEVLWSTLTVERFGMAQATHGKLELQRLTIRDLSAKYL